MAPLKSIAVRTGKARTPKPQLPAQVDAMDGMHVEATPVAEIRRPSPPSRTNPAHRYRIGERLRMANGGRVMSRGEAFCTIVARLPYEGRGALLYRVRSEAEAYERVVAEADLSRNSPDAP